MAAVTDTPPGLPNDPRLERRALGTDEMVVVLPPGHPQAGNTPVRIEALANEIWAEDHEGSAALLRQHAARAGVTVRIDLHAADLPGKIALVATGHAIALVPGVPVSALRADVTILRLMDPQTRGIYAILPQGRLQSLRTRRDPSSAHRGAVVTFQVMKDLNAELAGAARSTAHQAAAHT
jgi:DNA-binding transcriptional LysR family regulator